VGGVISTVCSSNTKVGHPSKKEGKNHKTMDGKKKGLTNFFSLVETVSANGVSFMQSKSARGKKRGFNLFFMTS